MKGYKVFNPDWTCKGFQYEVGKTYEAYVDPKCCERGFHFCERAADCFYYYSFDPDNKVAEVEAIGKVVTEGDKSCTNKIRIVREITWEEVLRIVNTGKSCTGLRNSGDWNSGDWNSGDGNSGDRNSGDGNSGDGNSGNGNSGYGNSGDGNSGDGNSGNGNSGYGNSGNGNSGDRNSGDWNSGDGNSGNWNSGDGNSGDRNSGDGNSGNGNSGYGNSGNGNSGDRNSGDWNKTSFSSGCFNTEESNILMFNKPSKWSHRDWFGSKARYLLSLIKHDVLEWICLDDMTEEEKHEHPEAETTGGYLKRLDESQCGQLWWNELSEENKKIIKDMPNFDQSVFEEITGIKIG